MFSSMLCVMMEEFKCGDSVCDLLDLKFLDWGKLFDLFLFFESYKNYL